MGRHLAPPATQIRDGLPLALQQVQAPGPLRIVRLPGQPRDAVVYLRQAFRIQVGVHGVEGSGNVGGAGVKAVGGLLDIGKHIALRRRQPGYQLENGQPITVDLQYGREVGAVLLGARGLDCPGPLRALHHGRLQRVGRWRSAQYIPPAVAALPERGIAPEQSDPHAEHGEEEPGLLDTGSDVDARTSRGDCRPTGELPPDPLNDLRLPSIRHDLLGSVPAAVPVSAGQRGSGAAGQAGRQGSGAAGQRGGNRCTRELVVSTNIA